MMDINQNPCKTNYDHSWILCYLAIIWESLSEPHDANDKYFFKHVNC